MHLHLLHILHGKGRHHLRSGEDHLGRSNSCPAGEKGRDALRRYHNLGTDLLAPGQGENAALRLPSYLSHRCAEAEFRALLQSLAD